MDDLLTKEEYSGGHVILIMKLLRKMFVDVLMVGLYYTII